MFQASRVHSRPGVGKIFGCLALNPGHSLYHIPGDLTSIDVVGSGRRE